MVSGKTFDLHFEKICPEKLSQNMTKYQQLIKKIHLWQQDSHYSTFNFSPEEVELIAEALETVEFLEKIFEVRKNKIASIVCQNCLEKK